MLFKLPLREAIASFDVDCQNAFTPECPQELPVPGGTEIVEQLNSQAQKASLRVGSKDSHHPHALWVAGSPEQQLSPIEGENLDVRWVRHAEVGSKGFELITGLPKVTDYDYFIWKGIELDMHPYGSCYHDFAEKMSTGVIEFLQAKKITTVIVGGLATDYCVKLTVIQLLKAGFTVVVNLAACRGLTPETTEQAIQVMQNQGAFFVKDSSALMTFAEQSE